MSDDADAILLERYFAGDMTAAEEAALQDRLRESDHFLRQFTNFIVFNEMLREGSATVLDPVNCKQADAPAALRPPRSRSTQRRPQNRRRRRSIQTRMLTASAGLLVIGLALGLLAVQTRDAGTAPIDSATVVSSRASIVVGVDGRERRLQPGDTVEKHMRIQTGPGGSTVIGYTDGTVLTLRSASEIAIEGEPGKRFRLERGSLRGEISAQPAGLPLVVETPTATATVLGTLFDLSVDPDRTSLAVEHGSVGLRRRSDDRQVIVGTGETADSVEMVARARRADPPPPTALPLIEAEALVDAAEADALVHSGQVRRPFLEYVTDASAGACLALPGQGTELSIPVPEAQGLYWLWIRYRDEDKPEKPLPSFAIVVDGTQQMELTVPGGTSDWIWSRCPVVVQSGTRIVLRSTFVGFLDHNSDVFAYRSVNRVDALRFTADPAYDPRQDTPIP